MADRAAPLAALRLEQHYRTDTGAENGSFIFRIHHLGGATLTPEKLCCAIRFPPAADTLVTGGRLIRRFANHFQFAPPRGSASPPARSGSWKSTSSRCRPPAAARGWRRAGSRARRAFAGST